MTQVQRGSTTALEAAVGEASAVAPRGGTTVSGMLEERRGRIVQALGKYSDADHFLETVVFQTQKEPKLLQCTHASLMGSVMQAAQLRLEFGQLGLVWMIPRRIKGQMQAVFSVGYRGYLALARRSGDVKDIAALPVYEKDVFRRWRDEHGEHLLHEPHLGEDRGDVVRYYGHCILNSGGQLIEVMELSDIAKRRAFSESANSDYSPWATNFDAMARKSCILKMKAFLPLTISDAQGLQGDEQVVEERGERLVVRYIDGQPAGIEQSVAELERPIPEANPSTGEILDVEPEPEAPETPPDASQSEVDVILAEIPPEVATEARAALRDHFGGSLDNNDPAVVKYLEDWLDAEPEPADPRLITDETMANAERTFAAAQPSLLDKPAPSKGVSDELLADTKKRIDTWSVEICDRVLGEWQQPKTGSLQAKRAKLLLVLAPARAAGNVAAIGLF